MSGTSSTSTGIGRIVSALRGRPRDEDVAVPPIGAPYVVVNAPHRPELRFDLLITALHQLASEGRDVTLVIAGAHTEYTRSLIGLCRGLGIADRVRFVGELSATGVDRMCAGALASARPASGSAPAASGGLPVVEWGRTMQDCADRLRAVLVDPAARARAIAARAMAGPSAAPSISGTLARAHALTRVTSLAAAAENAMAGRRT
jgi:glycosyltransferase involved in cell wall biosynthesis